MKFFPGRGRSVLSQIFTYTVDHISRQCGYILKDFNRPFLSEDNIDLLCESVRAKGSPYSSCFGFIDGTVRAICRPIRDQREVFSCVSCVKIDRNLCYSSIVLLSVLQRAQETSFHQIPITDASQWHHL